MLKNLIGIISLAFLAGCSDFFHPVDSTPAPTEYSYNYWLLQRTYLFEDELPSLDEEGDSVQLLYAALEDPYTRYVPPSKSEQATTTLNTSIVQGDIGLEYGIFPGIDHPLVVYRVYPKSPAGRAGVPRYSQILSVNGVDVVGEKAYETYKSVLQYNKSITLTVLDQDDTLTFEMEKEDVYAPTVFVDTLSGEIVITITEFKLVTVDQDSGTYGELKAYLDSTKNFDGVRLLDLRNNPGGHVNQCTAMADLFIDSGAVTTEYWRTFDPDGKSVYRKKRIEARKGDSGEGKKFMALVNKSSASCAEIFTAAIQEGAGIPVVGTASYGKGIGQSTWKTLAGGLSIITNLEFVTPKGNSYHKNGVQPDYPCESGASIQCGLSALQKYGQRTLKKSAYGSYESELKIIRKNGIGGALVEGDSTFF